MNNSMVSLTHICRYIVYIANFSSISILFVRTTNRRKQ